MYFFESKRIISCLTALLLLSVFSFSALAEHDLPAGRTKETGAAERVVSFPNEPFDFSEADRLFADGVKGINILPAETDYLSLGNKAKGDANGDGRIDTSDALLALRASVGIVSSDISLEYMCAVNEDGYVSSEDALQILKRTIGIINEFNVVDGSSYRVTDPYTNYTYAKLDKEIKAVAVRYHEAISLSSIGTTSGGKNLYLLRLGKGSKKVLYVGTMHGSEHINTAFLMRMAERYAYCYLAQRLFNGRDVYKLLNEYTIYIVPMINPDGADKAINEGISWKANGNGVDLNDNFPTSRWKDLNNGVTAPGRKDYKGPSAASEKETKALIKLCNENRFEFAISFHTKGQVIYWIDSLTKEVLGAKALTQKVVNSTGYKAVGTTTNVNDYAGGFENWFREAYSKPGLCVETTPSNGTTAPHDNAKFDSLIWSKASNVGLDVLS